jgi:Growth inhibitor
MEKSIKSLAELGSKMNFEVKYPEPKRGEIYMTDLVDMSTGTVHIMTKSRPSCIISNDIGNIYSGTVIVAFLTTTSKKVYPMQYPLILNGTDSVIMFEQIMTIDKNRLIEKMGQLTPKQMSEAEDKLMSSLQLNKFSLSNVKDIEVVNMNLTKTREGKYYSFTIEILFNNDTKQEIIIKLERLKEYDKTITEDTEFDDLKKKLDCCKGLNWLVNNNEL